MVLNEVYVWEGEYLFWFFVGGVVEIEKVGEYIWEGVVEE